MPAFFSDFATTAILLCAFSSFAVFDGKSKMDYQNRQRPNLGSVKFYYCLLFQIYFDVAG